MKLCSKAVGLLMGGLGCLATQAMASEVPEYVSIRSVQTQGSGCPLGTVARNISVDKKAFTLTFSDFLAEVFPGAQPIDFRKNCNIIVDLDFPEGWTYSVVSFDYRGFIDLDEGVTAKSRTSYYFQSDANEVSFTSNREGPYFDNYHFRDELGIGSLIWSPSCEGGQRPLTLKTEISLNGTKPDDFGMITVDSIDSEFRQKYKLVWKRCDKQDGGESGGGDEYRPPYDDQFPDAPSDLSIRSLVANGTGCPLGTVAKTISSDRRAFTLTYSDLYAQSGPGLSIRDQRRFCQLTIDIDAPSGWQYALATFDFRGYAYVDPGVSAIQSARYYTQGMMNDLVRETVLKGETPHDFYEGSYNLRDYIPFGQLNWSPCGAQRAFNMHTEVRVDNRMNRTGMGLLALDSVDGELRPEHKDLQNTYGLVWRRCR